MRNRDGDPFRCSGNPFFALAIEGNHNLISKHIQHRPCCPNFISLSMNLVAIPIRLMHMQSAALCSNIKSPQWDLTTPCAIKATSVFLVASISSPVPFQAPRQMT